MNPKRKIYSDLWIASMKDHDEVHSLPKRDRPGRFFLADQNPLRGPFYPYPDGEAPHLRFSEEGTPILDLEQRSLASNIPNELDEVIRRCDSKTDES